MSNGSLPESVPGIDIKKALDLLGLDDDIFKSILTGFMNSNSGTNDKIKSLFEKSDYEQLQKEAHTLKGSSANIGAYELQESSLQLEMASKEQNVNEAQINNIIEKLDIVISSISKL